MEEMDVVLTVPNGELSEAMAALHSEGDFDPDSMPASGAEGGGDDTSIVAKLSRKAVPIFTKIVQRFASGSDVSVVIGQTTLDAKRLNDPNVEALIAATLEAELKRAKGHPD